MKNVPDAYSPPRPKGPIDLELSRNEGRPAGPRLCAEPACDTQHVARYPDVTKLRQALAELAGVAVEQVLVTAGGDDALLRLCLAHLGPGTRGVVATPTFEMIPRYAELAGGELVETPWPRGAFPTDALLELVDERTGIAFVVSPNNPTGGAATARDLERIAEALPGGTVVLDAAYGEFTDGDLTAAGLELDNVVVVRTLSKAWGLAGLRVGYALGAPERLAPLAASGNPFPVSAASTAIALRRLATGADEVAEYVARARVERAELARVFASLGAEAVPSEANFVLARGLDAPRLADALAAEGIAIRAFPDRPDLTDAVRVTCPGDERAFERLIAALRRALAQENPR